jgi:phosphoribosylformylglycinamidine synthase I
MVLVFVHLSHILSLFLTLNAIRFSTFERMKKLRWAVVTFPGSNCDRDMMHLLHHWMGQDAISVWHATEQLPEVDVVVLPGGFSYGDYLRSGALASTSKIMQPIRTFAANGGKVLGICNGFQILTEAKLLPGALARNVHKRFICEMASLQAPASLLPTWASFQNQSFSMPIAHAEGRFVADEATLQSLKEKGQIILTYTTHSNPNGSSLDIAGICNDTGNVVGLMPHPERAADPWLPSRDGYHWLSLLMNVWFPATG